ncbi:MAG TPA: hypothetical protein VEH84_14440 [Alphaproteobacteria bacterium]|nr:hypothetical protein [Alphaproteobacteria bacterium]
MRAKAYTWTLALGLLAGTTGCSAVDSVFGTDLAGTGGTRTATTDSAVTDSTAGSTGASASASTGSNATLGVPGGASSPMASVGGSTSDDSQGQMSSWLGKSLATNDGRVFGVIDDVVVENDQYVAVVRTGAGNRMIGVPTENIEVRGDGQARLTNTMDLNAVMALPAYQMRAGARSLKAG